MGGKNSNDICHCWNWNDAVNANNILARLLGVEKLEWLAQQEVILLNEIQVRLNQSFPTFNEGLVAYIDKFWAPEQIPQDVYRDIDNELLESRNKNKKQRLDAYARKVAFEHRFHQYFNTPNFTDVGWVKHQGVLLRSAPINLLGSWITQANLKIVEQNKAAVFLEKRRQAYSTVVQGDLLRANIKLQHFNYIAAHEDPIFRVALLRNYLIAQNLDIPAPQVPPQFYPPLYQSNPVFTLDQLVTQTFSSLPDPPTPTFDLTGAEAFDRFVINYLGIRASDYILKDQKRYDFTADYLRSNDFSQECIDEMQDLYNSFLDRGSLSLNNPIFAAPLKPADIQINSRPNSALLFYSGDSDTYRMNNILSRMHNYNYEGAIYKEHFSRAGVTIPTEIPDSFLGRLFDFNDGNLHYGEIGFVNNIGAILLQNGYSIYDIFDLENKPLIYEATLAMLTYGSEMILYLQENNFSDESLRFAQKANQVTRENPSINTINEIIDYLIARNEIFYVDGGTKKVNPVKETKCFDLTKPAIVTIYVEQPIKGSREITVNIGHTFVGIEQGGIARYLGFYPENPRSTLFTPQDAEIHNNSESPYHVSVSTEVKPDQLKRIINDINNFQKKYILNDYNCSHFGIQIGRKAGLNLPKTIGEYGFFPFKFEGVNPADLGEDIRSLNSNSTITVDKKGGKAPKKKGGC